MTTPERAWRRHAPRLKAGMRTPCTSCDREVGVTWRNGQLKLSRHQRWPEDGICTLSGTTVDPDKVTGLTPKPLSRFTRVS